MDKNWNPSVSIFQNCKSPAVINEVTIEKILQEIKTGGKNHDLLIEARRQGKNSSFYESVKTKHLKTFSPNATFNHKRNLIGIKKLSGLVYLDIDGCTKIDFDNPYIFAAWLSLSGTGRGVLVKAEGLNEDNFFLAYDSIAHEIGLVVDPACKDLTRQVVISYDPDIYINHNSKPYYCNGNLPKKITSTPLSVPFKNKEKRICERKGDKNFKDIRYDNTQDYNLEGKDYEVFDEKVMFSRLFIPEVIKTNRYSTISTAVHQLMALNSHLQLEAGKKFIDALNGRCLIPLPKNEILKIKRDIEHKIQTGNLTPIPNWGRYTAFSEKVAPKERQVIGAKVAGRNKKRKTIEKIQECLDSWDLNLGRVTNQKIAELTGRAKKTVDKYSKEFFKTQKEIINNNI